MSKNTLRQDNTGATESGIDTVTKLSDKIRNCNKALETLRLEMLTLMLERKTPSPSQCLNQEMKIKTDLSSLGEDVKNWTLEEKMDT